MRKERLSRSLAAAKAAENAAEKEAAKQVMIEKVINLKLMCDYAVTCSYGDIVLIIAMLRDYVCMLDEVKADDIQYQAYYREKFLGIADRLSQQIEYDYDDAVERCKKKQAKDDNSDVGGEAMELAYKKAVAENARKEAGK